MDIEDRQTIAFGIALLGRIAFPAERLREIISAGGAGSAQINAYNLADGTRTQAEIVKELGLDRSNFSKSLKRWEEAGVLVRLGEGRDRRPFGLYKL